LLVEFPDRFVIGSDTWVNARWQYYEEQMQEYREWLGDLPAAVARQVAWDNAARLFGLP
jgi:predicted TIM-barrel fold metal-dependent hydrolase